MAQPSFPGLPPLAELTGARAPSLNNSSLYPSSTVNGINPVYDFTHLKYPQEISYSNYQGHYINFFINIHTASEFYRGGSYVSRGEPPSRSSVGTYQAVNVQPVTFNNVGPLIQSHAYQRISQAISLYIPDSMLTEQNIQWETASILKGGQKMMRGMGDAAGKSAASTTLKKVGQAALRSLSGFADVIDIADRLGGLQGFAVNPQLLVMFRTIEPRRFQYEFYFSPRNEQEAQNVYDIIYTFRFHAAPEAQFSYGAFFTAPSTFDIEFMHKGIRNTWVNQVKTCVLIHYSVDYAPSGWSTHVDGSPVRTRLVLQFQETDIICKADIKKGY